MMRFLHAVCRPQRIIGNVEGRQPLIVDDMVSHLHENRSLEDVDARE